jgi:hypothetical protein
MNLQKLYELDLARQELGGQLAAIPCRARIGPDPDNRLRRSERPCRA